MGLKALYHAALPDAVRYPIGRARRTAADRWIRLRTGGPPLPPPHLLRTVQMTSWIREYLRVGRASAAAVTAALDAAGVGPAARVLDFGCGLGRTLRFLVERPGPGWRLSGCDVERDSIAWCRRAFPGVRFRASWPQPPLPFRADAFDAVYAISVFTHFDAPEQRTWAAELARVVRAGGWAAISTMGPRAFGSFRELQTRERRAALEHRGFVFDPAGSSFNQRGAFHTAAGLAGFFDAADWQLERTLEGGVDGFQDLHLLRRRGRPGLG